MAEGPASDRRRHQRVRLNGRVEGQATVSAGFRVVSLSEDGAALDMPIPLPLGSHCDLRLSLSHATVDLRGTVVNIRTPTSPGGSHRVGVEFMTLPPMDRALLEAFLERERRKSE